MIQQPAETERPKFDPDDDKAFADYLNELYEPVTICGITFDQGTAIRELDPTAFNCMRNDMQEYTTIYTCPVCCKEHEDRDDALWCCQTQPACEICGMEWDTEEDAETCCVEGA